MALVLDGRSAGGSLLLVLADSSGMWTNDSYS